MNLIDLGKFVEIHFCMRTAFYFGFLLLGDSFTVPLGILKKKQEIQCCQQRETDIKRNGLDAREANISIKEDLEFSSNDDVLDNSGLG